MVVKAITSALLVAGFVLGVSSAAYAADEKKEPPKVISGASAQMLADTCAGCHGTDGASMGPASPTISGNSEKYIVELMEGFAAGTIPSTVMGRIAKGYSKEEIDALAKFYAGKPFVAAKQEFDQAQADAGAKTHDKMCEKCHADKGTDVKDDTGRLAGQWVPYLKAAMADFIGGKREMTKKMKNKVMELHTKDGDKAFEELFAFYASQQ